MTVKAFELADTVICSKMGLWKVIKTNYEPFTGMYLTEKEVVLNMNSDCKIAICNESHRVIETNFEVDNIKDS